MGGMAVRRLVPVLMVVALLVGCSKRAERVASTDVTAAQSASPLVGGRGVQAAAAQVATQAVPQSRMIVRTANVRIIVADTAKAVDAITTAAEAGGGYVADSSVWRDGELLRARLTLRVPAEKLTSTLASIRGVAKRVDNETLTSEDVSQEYVDLESQLRNLEATENELRELMTSIRQTSRKASEVLEIHQQMTAIRGEIERTKGRMRYLGQTSALSTIQLELVPDAIAQPVVQPGWRPMVVLRDASRALVAAMQGLATVAIWFIIYLAPLLALLMLAVLAIRKLARRMRSA
jgi:hypothetical protein